MFLLFAIYFTSGQKNKVISKETEFIEEEEELHYY